MNNDTPVTLFLCNVAPTLPDTFICTILKQCGNVIQWRRALGIKDPTDFGFVDYSGPNDATCALRILPQITVLDMKWEVYIDENRKFDLLAYEHAKQLTPGYDQLKESRNDNLILRMINELIYSSQFAKAVQRLEQNLESEFDDFRESEHFKYLKEIRLENEELEEHFRTNLLEWKRQESKNKNEIKAISKQFQVNKDRIEREEFLKNYSCPDISPESVDQKCIDEYNLFNTYRKERKAMRQRELEIEKLCE